MADIKKERLEEICKKLINYLGELPYDEEQLHDILEVEIRMTDDEIDQLSGN